MFEKLVARVRATSFDLRWHVRFRCMPLAVFGSCKPYLSPQKIEGCLKVPEIRKFLSLESIQEHAAQRALQPENEEGLAQFRAKPGDYSVGVHHYTAISWTTVQCQT